MVLGNKAIGSFYADGTGQRELRVLPVMFQNFCAISLLELLRSNNVVKYNWIDMRSAHMTLPLAGFFVGMLVTGFISLNFLNVAMVTVFKNLTNIIIVFGEWYFFNQRVSRMVLTSFTVMIVGAVLAAQKDVAYTRAGYLWMAANCVLTAGYVLYMRRVTNSVELSRFSAVLFNNATCLVMLFGLALSTGEVRHGVATVSRVVGVMDSASSTVGAHLPFICINLFTGVVAFGMNFASLWCVSSTSATTYAMVGCMNKVPIAILGSILFHTTMSSETVFYIAINILGGFLFSYAKLGERKA